MVGENKRNLLPHCGFSFAELQKQKSIAVRKNQIKCTSRKIVHQLAYILHFVVGVVGSSLPCQ